MAFFTELGVNLENCESMLVVYILGWSSFLQVTKDEFDKARTAHKSIEGIASHVKREIQNKYAAAVMIFIWGLISCSRAISRS